MQYKNRSDIEEQYKWDLTKLFPSDSAWEDEYKIVQKEYKNILVFKNNLKTAKDLFNCFQCLDNYSRKISNLFTYAKMSLDQDAKSNIYQEQVKKISNFIVEYQEATSFVSPQINNFSKEDLIKFSEDKLLEEYKYSLSKMAINKEHILSEKEEELLAGVGSFSDDFHAAFSAFDNAEIKFNKVRNDENVLTELTHGNYSMFLSSKDLSIRKKAFKNMFNSYKNMNETISTLYAGQVKADCFYAKARKYKSAMDQALVSEDVTINVYENLIKSVHANLKNLHRYFKLRANQLGYKKLNMWDLHLPIFNVEDIKLSYAEALETVKSALAVLGDEYVNLIDKAVRERWIDVYETPGKRNGAYSWGTYDSPPYVLLNYFPTTHDIFTIAHELGHSMHSYFSHKEQPYATAQYEIFVAEVASTVNEVLLLKYLLKTTTNKELKKYLLSYYLDMFRTTLFRQTQFAEFEKLAHEHYEQGYPLTSEFFNKEYLKLNKLYYGSNVVSCKLIQYEWSRIPHFYNSFYVYKYATGITSAVIIANNILSGDKEKLQKYFKFLSLGGSMSPVEILKVAGVNLEKVETFNIAMQEFNNILTDLERECRDNG